MVVVFEAVEEEVAADAEEEEAVGLTELNETVAPDDVVVVPVDRRLSLRLAAEEELGEVDLERLS